MVLLKKFFYFALPLFLLIMLLTYGSSSFLSSHFLNCNASVIINNYSDVKFYGTNNDLIYSINVENGKTLNDYNNNLLLNPYFKDYSYSNGVYTFDNWVKYSSNLTLLPGDNYGIIIVESDNLHSNFQQRFTNASYFVGKTITCSIKFVDDDTLYYTTYFINSSSKVTKIDSLEKPGSYFLVKWSDSNYGFQVNAFFYKSGTYNIEYIKVEYGETPTPYFSENYVNDLYALNGGVISNDYTWSKFKDKSYLSFDFNSYIYNDTNLYYTHKTKYFSIVNTWQDFLGRFSNSTTYSSNALDKVKIYYVSFISSINSINEGAWYEAIFIPIDILILCFWFIALLVAIPIDLLYFAITSLTFDFWVFSIN